MGYSGKNFLPSQWGLLYDVLCKPETALFTNTESFDSEKLIEYEHGYIKGWNPDRL